MKSRVLKIVFSSALTIIVYATLEQLFKENSIYQQHLSDLFSSLAIATVFYLIYHFSKGGTPPKKKDDE